MTIKPSKMMIPRIGRELCLFLPFLLLRFTSVHSGCEYPSFVQSTGHGPSQIRREWHSHLQENARESHFEYSTITNFYSHVMRTTIFGGQKAKNKPDPYTRECILEIRPGYFLSVHKVDGEQRQYLCMFFEERSPDVFQLRQSKLSDLEDANLCNEDAMELDNWVFINRVNLFQSYGDCHLHGGYNVKIYDKQSRLGVCDALTGETRIESECMAGEGIFFRFRYSNCVPKGLHMHKNQQTYCMASWQDGANTFTILRSDRKDYVWCLRYPSMRKGSFKAFLFRDAYCETADLPWSFVNYMSMDMFPDTVRGLSELCVDDYEGCKYWTSPCRFAGYVHSLTCAKMCGICTESRPSMCTLPSQFRGEWLAKDDDHTHRFSIDDRHLSIKEYTDLRCVQWDPRHHSTQDTDYIEQMFVTTFDNGCRPRYTCAQLKKYSPSILRYKLSEAQVWPFENTNGMTVDCGSFKYKDMDEPHRSHFHSRHFQTIISETERIYVDCKLEESKEFDVIFQGDLECTGQLTQEGLSTRNKMKLILSNCPGHQAEQEFACLDSSKHGYLGEQLMVTETLDSFNRIRCWLFPMHPQLTFYLLPVAECNEGANEKILSGIVRPLATFKEHPKLKLSIIVENAIETKPARAEAVRKAPYLREDGQHWKEIDEDDERYHNDGKLGIELNQQKAPNYGGSSAGVNVSCSLVTVAIVALTVGLVL